jgi:hypothetical protein
MTRDSLARALEDSSLLQGAAAASVLQDGWKIDAHPSATPYQQIASVYSLRSERLRRMRSPHARQLAASTEEFVANLNQHRASSGNWFTINGPEEHEFLVFCSDSDEPLACLCIVSQLRASTERWTEIWGDDATSEPRWCASDESARGSTILSYPRCSQQLRVPSGKTLHIICTKCRYQFDRTT